MAVKSFKVRFYGVHVQQEEDAPKYGPNDLFAELEVAARAAGGLCPPFSDGNHSYEIREMASFNNGAVYRGVFAVLRDDAPNIRKSNGTERPIPLADDEGVIEKNHFLYYARRRMLVYQVNQRANHPSRFENYLTAMSGLEKSVVFADILTTDSWQRMHQGTIKSVEVTLDIPRAPELFDPDDFTGPTLHTMQQAGAMKAHVTLSAGRGNELREWVKRQLDRARGMPHVKSLGVRIEGEDGILDLIGNTVRDTIEVQMDGRYPNTRKTFEELESARHRQREALRAHFGQ